MTTGELGAVARVYDLYQSVMSAPEAWTDDALEAWGHEAFSDGLPPTRDVAREVRRCLRVSRKLRDFWAEPPPGVPSDAGDWRSRVDVALGIRAWRPVLELAKTLLHEGPSVELFEEVKALFRVVEGGRWMEGVSFEEWLADGP